MIAIELLAWWYRQGWMQVAQNARLRFLKVSHMFSVPILIRTLFAPWRRIITYPGATIDARMRALGDNLVSRTVGFTVRIMVLLTAGIMLGLTVVAAGLQLIVWPLVPLALVAAIFKGIIG